MHRALPPWTIQGHPDRAAAGKQVFRGLRQPAARARRRHGLLLAPAGASPSPPHPLARRRVPPSAATARQAARGTCAKLGAGVGVGPETRSLALGTSPRTEREAKLCRRWKGSGSDRLRDSFTDPILWLPHEGWGIHPTIWRRASHVRTIPKEISGKVRGAYGQDRNEGQSAGSDPASKLQTYLTKSHSLKG